MARDCKPLSEQCHHGLCRTDVNARGFLDIKVGHLAVLNDHGKPLAACSLTKYGAVQFKTQFRGQFAIAVGEHNDVVGILRSAPAPMTNASLTGMLAMLRTPQLVIVSALIAQPGRWVMEQSGDKVPGTATAGLSYR